MIVRKDQLKLRDPYDPILHTKPEPYDFEKEGSTAKIFANALFDQMIKEKGVGLSANQLGINRRVFVIGIDDLKIFVFNPKIIEEHGEELYEEGCLSYPGVKLKLKRPSEIVVEYQIETGEVVRNTFRGLTARVFLHEYDHMEGLTMKDRVSKLKWDLAVRKARK
jgi:peptide deformylase